MRYCFLKTIVWIRWVYFHLNPMYVKFYMAADEPWFQHRKLGIIHCDYQVLREPPQEEE